MAGPELSAHLICLALSKSLPRRLTPTRGEMKEVPCSSWVGPWRAPKLSPDFVEAAREAAFVEVIGIESKFVA